MIKPVITLMGATASGKTRLAIALYKKHPNIFTIVNVDSALIYRNMDIGTAKPSKEELSLYPHALVDIVDPSETYSVGSFAKDIETIINKAHQENKIPILVGGTMLYYRSLLGKIDDLPASTEESRAWVTNLENEVGKEQMHQMLKDIDPPAFQRLHPNDTQRVGRVLEVWFLTGKGMSEISNNNSDIYKHANPLDKKQRNRRINKSLFNSPHFKLEDYLLEYNALNEDNCLPPFENGLFYFKDAKGNELTSKYNLLQFAMYNQDREELHNDITKRLEIMFQEGLEEEVRKLYNRGDLNLNMPSVRCVGYRQLWGYFDGEYSLEEAKEKIAIATRQLAKRQITWLRSWPLPFVQIHTKLKVEQQIAIIEKVLNLALEREKRLNLNS